MRLRNVQNKEELETFDNFLTSIGEGTYPTISPDSEYITPPDFLQCKKLTKMK